MNLNYQWSGSPDGSFEGVIINPSGVARSATFNKIKGVIADRILLDPQIYLLDLEFQPDECPTFVENLASYTWFGMTPPDFDSGAHELRQPVAGEPNTSNPQRWASRVDIRSKWSTTVREAVNLQVEYGCDAILLPATLIRDPATTLQEDLQRLEEALSIAPDLAHGLPIYASIPLADSLFIHGGERSTHLIESIVDNVSIYKQLKGVYIPFIQLGEPQDRLKHSGCAEGLLRLANRLSACTELESIFNYVESLGIVCRALGGSGYGTGYHTKQRRLHAADFRPKVNPKEQPRAYPKFFSLDVCVDFRLEKDLDRMSRKRLIGKLKGDLTESSRDLLQALKKRIPTSKVPQWEDRGGNITVARHHYFQQHQKARTRIADPDEALAWLQDAEATWKYLGERFDNESGGPLGASGAHLAPWRLALENVLGEEP